MEIAPESSGRPIRCKAAICRKAGEALVIEEIQVDPPRAWEVRIKILCTTICHTDVTWWKRDAGPYAVFPRILGHEAIGVVESVGENVEEVKAGDTVLPVFLPNCERCTDCKSTKGNRCSVFGERPPGPGMPRDGTGRFKSIVSGGGGGGGEDIHHFLGVSSFTEYTVVDVVQVVKISAQIPVDRACLLSCGVSTGLGGALKVADVEEGSSVAIFGLGAVGLAVAEGARLRGVSKIIGVDLNPDKFEMGKKFGITDFINPAACGEKPVSQVIREMTDGGADYCFECVGLASLMTEAFNSSREGWGKTVILGVEVHGKPLSLSSYEFLRGKSVVGSFLGGFKPKADIPLLAHKYIHKELNLDEFITQEVSFKDINKALDLLIAGQSLRCIIWMDR